MLPIKNNDLLKQSSSRLVQSDVLLLYPLLFFQRQVKQERRQKVPPFNPNLILNNDDIFFQIRTLQTSVYIIYFDSFFQFLKNTVLLLRVIKFLEFSIPNK